MYNILLLGSGTQALAIIKPLHKSGNKIYMIIGKKGNYADVSKYVDKKFLFDAVVDTEEYLTFVISIIEKNNIDVLIPTGDATAEFISRNKAILQKYVHFKAPDLQNFLKGYDKNLLMKLCRENGFPHPLTIDLAEIDYMDENAFKAFPYPGILKPNYTTGGRGMVLIHSYQELVQMYPEIKKEYGECHLQRYIANASRQVKFQLYVNDEGELINHSVMDKVRWYPVKGGSSCCSVSIDDEKMVSICYEILKKIHWVGFADFDTIGDSVTQELLIMEINPRIPACLGAAIRAGINWGQIMVDDCMEQPQKKYEYRVGVALRHLGFDFLWFLQSPHRFKVKPSWFHFFGSNVYYQDFDFFDQRPFWIGTYHNMQKTFNKKFRKSKIS